MQDWRNARLKKDNRYNQDNIGVINRLQLFNASVLKDILNTIVFMRLLAVYRKVIDFYHKL
jgi:hypothetical protein